MSWLMLSAPDLVGLQSLICKNGLRITSPLSGCSPYTTRLLGSLCTIDVKHKGVLDFQGWHFELVSPKLALHHA